MKNAFIPLPLDPKRGRGTGLNPTGRFNEVRYDATQVIDEAYPDEMDSGPRLRTTFYTDASRTIVTKNDSPDVGFDYGINSYRGCEHGCIYCYARPTHEYFGLSAGEDFESKIFVKERGPELLREKLLGKSWQPQVIMMSGVTDCYQPAERKYFLTRRCLEVLAEFRNPVSIITKNHLVTRDIDVLKTLAKSHAAMVILSVTTLNSDLCSKLEPRTSRPAFRLDAIRQLADAGIPVGVNVAPVIPGLTDEEIPAILEAAHQAGARFAGFTMLRLPYGVKDLFEDWVKREYPDRAEKVLNRIRSMRDGKLNTAEFGSRMHGEGIFAEQIRALFKLSCKKIGMSNVFPSLSTSAFRRPSAQLSWLDEANGA